MVYLSQKKLEIVISANCKGLEMGADYLNIAITSIIIP